MTSLWDENAQERVKKEQLNAAHAELVFRFLALQSSHQGANALSALQGVPGAAASIAQAVASEMISDIEAKIENVKIQIEISTERSSSIKDTIERFERNLNSNADEINLLGCIL